MADDQDSLKGRFARLVVAIVGGVLVAGLLIAAGVDVVLAILLAWLVTMSIAAVSWVRHERNQSPD